MGQTPPKLGFRKPNVLIDAKVEAEFPGLFRYRRSLTPEDRAKELEAACRDFANFIRDHRSQDPVSLDVIRVTQNQCSECGKEWDPYEDGDRLYCGNCGVEVTLAAVPPPNYAASGNAESRPLEEPSFSLGVSPACPVPERPFQCGA